MDIGQVLGLVITAAVPLGLGLMAYGRLQARLDEAIRSKAELRDEITRLHERANNNKSALANVQLQIATDLAAIKSCIVRLETLITERTKHGDE